MFLIDGTTMSKTKNDIKSFIFQFLPLNTCHNVRIKYESTLCRSTAVKLQKHKLMYDRLAINATHMKSGPVMT